MIFTFSESLCCWKPSIQFLHKRRYGLEGDAGWKIPRWLFRAWPSLMCELDEFTYTESPFCRKPSIKFFSRDYMVVKKVLVEEFQDGSLVHGHF